MKHKLEVTTTELLTITTALKLYDRRVVNDTDKQIMIRLHDKNKKIVEDDLGNEEEEEYEAN